MTSLGIGEAVTTGTERNVTMVTGESTDKKIKMIGVIRDVRKVAADGVSETTRKRLNRTAEVRE